VVRVTETAAPPPSLNTNAPDNTRTKQPNIAFPRGVDRIEGVTSNGIMFKFVLGRKDDSSRSTPTA